MSLSDSLNRRLDLLQAYQKLYTIRRVEEEIADRYREGLMRCPTHLSLGQETAAVGVCMALQSGDLVFSTHRCHAHYLAQGGSIDALIAELYGKATGAAGGWGGSMHLVAEQVGFAGTSAIVGSSISVALGAALGFQLKQSSNCAVAFFGDAALETGQFYECVNMAALWKLPIILVCENNGLSTQTPIIQRQPNRSIRRVVNEMGLSFTSALKNDELELVYLRTSEARQSLPAFIEIPTNRWRTHVGPEYDHELGLTFRPEHVIDAMMADDQVGRLYAELWDEHQEELALMINSVDKEVSEAFEKAEAAPWPEVDSHV